MSIFSSVSLGSIQPNRIVPGTVHSLLSAVGWVGAGSVTLILAGCVLLSLMVIEILERLGSGRGLQLLILAVVGGSWFWILRSDGLESLSLVREFNARPDKFEQAFWTHVALAFGAVGISACLALVLALKMIRNVAWRRPILGAGPVGRCSAHNACGQSQTDTDDGLTGKGFVRMIELKNVTRRFGDAVAVDRINLTVETGEVCVLVGSSGRGKSTTLRMTNRFLPLSEGKILVDGEDITAMNPEQLRLNMGYVIQSTGLFPHWTVARNIAMVPQLLQLAAGVDRRSPEAGDPHCRDGSGPHHPA